LTANATAPTKRLPARRALLWLGLAALILLAFALRLYRLDAVPLRGDEAYSVLYWTAPPFSAEWWASLRVEPAPPGTLVAFWAWSETAGDSPFAMRYLSLLGNVIGLAAVMALARRLLGDARLTAMVGLLWALHPELIWHAQDARSYGLLSALSPLAFYWLVRAVDGHGFRRWWPYILLQSAALYVNLLEPFWIAAQGVYILALGRGDVLRRALGAWGVIALLALPVGWQAVTLLFVSGYEGTAAGADLTRLLDHFAPVLLLGIETIPAWLGGLLAGMLFVGLIWLARRDRAGWLLLAWGFLPVLLLYGASHFADYFRPRYVTTVIPALVIALVAVLAALGRSRSAQARIYAPALLTAVLAVVSLAGIYHYFYRAAPKAPDWPGLAAYLTARTGADDVIISDSIDPALEYYHDGPARVFFIPADRPPPEAYLPGLLSQHRTIYLLAGAHTGGAAEFLRVHSQHIPGDTWPGVSQFRPWRVDEAEISHRLAVDFSDVARLRGYTLVGDDQLLLYWEALDTTINEHSVLVHVERAADAPPEAVLDHGLAGGVVSARTWTPGTLYRDPVALPVELPAGEYTIRVGLYDLVAEERVAVVDGAEYDGRYPLTQMTISAGR
jgi:hypothetical protein